jgi:hypothetical protein
LIFIYVNIYIVSRSTPTNSLSVASSQSTVRVSSRHVPSGATWCSEVEFFAWPSRSVCVDDGFEDDVHPSTPVWTRSCQSVQSLWACWFDRHVEQAVSRRNNAGYQRALLYPLKFFVFFTFFLYLDF